MYIYIYIYPSLSLSLYIYIYIVLPVSDRPHLLEAVVAALLQECGHLLLLPVSIICV